jgi:hypothetical protein
MLEVQRFRRTHGRPEKGGLLAWWRNIAIALIDPDGPKDPIGRFERNRLWVLKK